jgi:hypothetical protein
VPYLGTMGHLVVISAGTGTFTLTRKQSAPDGQVKFAFYIARPEFTGVRDGSSDKDTFSRFRRSFRGLIWTEG